MDNTEWDLMASVWVSIDRTQHCLSNYIAPDHPDYVKNKDTRIGKKVADIFRQTDDAIGSFVQPRASRTTSSCSSATTGSSRAPAR